MKIRINSKEPSKKSLSSGGIQDNPVALPHANGSIKVDAAYRIGDVVLVAGWRTAPVELSLRAGDQDLDARLIRVSRPDVANHLKIETADELGFVLMANHEEDAQLTLSLQKPGDSKPVMRHALAVTSKQEISASDHGALGPAVGLFATSLQIHSSEWKDLVSKAPSSPTPSKESAGFIEAAMASEHTGQGVVVGWELHAPNTQVWLEDDSGITYSLEGAFRRFRQDVLDAVGHNFPHASPHSGFVVRVEGMKPGSTVRLKSISSTGVHVHGEAQCGPLSSDPVEAARWLFSVHSPHGEFHRRVGLVDEPLLTPMIQRKQSLWKDLPLTIKRLGQAPDHPQASIIVPLYGRMDFVEHQLIEFTKDAWIRENAEIIYVLDDPKLLEPFSAHAEALHRLYRIPFTWLWGSANRGFSGANNLAAEHARGHHFIFLNSDAFPQKPGWAQALIEALATHPEIGAIGPRLVFADGSIQHAGIEFMRRDELGIWINHHPRMGLDPVLDPHHDLTILTSVTGACLTMRRGDFEQVGGWDSHYLIGDFEDTDLCLKLRKAGFQIAYLPSVQLTHLERQSFKLLGQDEFRTRVVIYNAVRHQNRWSDLIEASASKD